MPSTKRPNTGVKMWLLTVVAVVTLASHACITNAYKINALASTSTPISLSGVVPTVVVETTRTVHLIARDWNGPLVGGLIPWREIAVTTVPENSFRLGQYDWYSYGFKDVVLPSWAWKIENGKRVANVMVDNNGSARATDHLLNLTGHVFDDDAARTCYRQRLEAGGRLLDWQGCGTGGSSLIVYTAP